MPGALPVLTLSPTRSRISQLWRDTLVYEQWFLQVITVILLIVMKHVVRGTKQQPRFLRWAIASAALCTLSLWPATPTQAGIYSVRLLPSVTQANVGASFTVDLKANMVVDSAATGKISGSVTYPADIVQLQNVVNGGYPEVTLTQSSGQITVSSPDKGSGNGYGGQQVIFTATFKAIAGGTASFAASNGVMVVNGTNHVVVAGSVTTIGCPPSYTGTYPNCNAPPSPAPSPTPTPTPPASNTPTTPSAASASPSSPSTNPAASPQQAIAIAPQKSGSSLVTITETSNEVTPTSVHVTLQATAALRNLKVQYGTAKDALTHSTVPNQNGTAIEYEAHDLEPGTVCYFKLSGIDSSNKDIGYQTGYQTKGYPVKIKLSGTGISLANRHVTIDDTPYVTDADGAITAYLSPNDYTVTDAGSGTSMTITVVRASIASGQNPIPQEFALQLAGARSKARTQPWIISLSSVTIIALTACSAFIFWRHHGKHAHGMGHGAWDTSPYVPVEKPKQQFMAPTAVAPQSVILPEHHNSADDDTYDDTAGSTDTAIEADDTMLWNRKTLPPAQGPHTSPYIEGTKAALGAHTKDHRPKIDAMQTPKIKGVRSRTEIKPDEDTLDPDEE